MSRPSNHGPTYPDVIFPEPSAQSRSTALRAFAWVGHRVQDVHGARLGRVVGLVVDRQSGRPQWLLVEERPDRFRCVPLTGVVAGGGRVTVPFGRDVYRSAPLAPPDGALTPRQERELCRAYRVDPTRGAKLSLWERRRSTALAHVEPTASGGYSWEPPARIERERRAGLELVQGTDLPPALLLRRRSDERLAS